MKKTVSLGLGVAAVAVVAGLVGWQPWASRVPQYPSAPFERGDVVAAISASGTVGPVSQVTVGTQVSGQIKALYADFNQTVTAGQPLALLDPAIFEFRLRSAQADLDAAQAAVLTAQANVAAGHAQVLRAQTERDEARRTHDRNLKLVAQGFVAQSEADRTRALLATAEASLQATQAQLQVTQAQLAASRAVVSQRQAAVAQAEVDVTKTRILSPVDGIVIKRSVDRGQTVAASLQAPELFVIAQNLKDMQVLAGVDEADVGRIRDGQKASFTVDAFPGRHFEGLVRQVRQAAQTVSNVVTYTVVVDFTNDKAALLPGMTANVKIITREATNAWRVPNAALRVKVPVEHLPAGVVPPSGAKVYVLNAHGQPEPVAVKVGLTDGRFSEVTAAPDQALPAEGARIVTGAASADDKPSGLPRLRF